MRFHHVCLFVSDMDASLALYEGILGFDVGMDAVIPDAETVGADLVDATLGPGARSRMAWLTSPEGAILELQQIMVPASVRTPAEQLRSPHTGHHEVAFHVTDIDGWWDRISTAGYELQTDHVWSWGPSFRSFLFYDPDGHIVQLVDDPTFA